MNNIFFLLEVNFYERGVGKQISAYFSLLSTHSLYRL